MSGKKGLVNGNNCHAFLFSFNKILKTLCQDWVRTHHHMRRAERLCTTANYHKHFPLESASTDHVHLAILTSCKIGKPKERKHYCLQ